MKTSSKTITGSLIVGAGLSLAGGACGPAGAGGGESGDVFLTIVGDRSVYLDGGERTELRVRYHDREDQPLHGEVEFATEGDLRGAQLKSTTATTDEEGLASVTLDATNEEETSFQVKASAAEAGTVSWEITLEEPFVPLEPNGTYQIDSSFDMVSGLEEGNVRDVVHTVRDFTEDPGTYLLRLAIEACGSTCDSLSGIADTVGPLLTNYLEDQFPQFMKDLLDLGAGFFDHAHNFRVASEISIEGEEGARSAEHLLTGVVIDHEGEENIFPLNELGVETVEAANASFSMTEDQSEVSISEHEVPLPYGTMLSVTLEEVLLASLEGSPEDLASFLNSRIDCAAVGSFLDDEIGLLPITFSGLAIYDGEDLCQDGIDAGAGALDRRIKSLDDAGFELVISGTAEPASTTEEPKVDVLRYGGWGGSLDYGDSAAATLDARENAFEAERAP